MISTSANCLLDANILVYAVSKSPVEAVKKKRALELILDKDFGLSAQVLQEFYVTVTRKLKQPIPHDEAMEFLSSLAAFPLIPVDFELIRRGAEVSQRFQISYWDGAIISAAERLTAQILYSEDLSHNQLYGSVKVINPFLNAT
jgi:predicted nucleic acid-binding protein